jgi:hypothetical protein
VRGPVFFRRNPIPTQGDPAYDSTALAGRRFKPRGKQRKPYAIEAKLHAKCSASLARAIGLRDWHIHSRYVTAARRDQALDTLTKKEDKTPWKWRYQYRKKDE